ncbi:MAG: ABC exporter membrane fusion protein [Elainella sp.]
MTPNQVHPRPQRIKLPLNRWGIGLGAALVIGSIGLFRPQPAQPPVVAQPLRAVTALGRLEPQGEVINIAAPMYPEGARIAELRVEATDQVRSGQIIAVLDRRDRLQAALDQAQRQVAVAQAQLAQVKAGAKRGAIQAQQAQIGQIQAQMRDDVAAKRATLERQAAEVRNAQLEAQRYQTLYLDGAVSASLRDSKQLTLETAQQRLSEARAALNQTASTLTQQLNAASATLDQIAEVRPTDIQAAEAEVASALATVQTARSNLETAYVRAPQDGQILRIQARSGEIVGPEGIAELGNTRQMEVVAEVYETDLAKLRLGQPVTLTSLNQAFSGELQGRVYRILPQIAKQDVLNTDPAARIDARVAEVRIRLDPSDLPKLQNLTNLTVQAVIQLGG